MVLKKTSLNQFFFGLFDLFKKKDQDQDCKRPTNGIFWSQSCLILVQFGYSLLPVLGLDFQTLAEIGEEGTSTGYDDETCTVTEEARLGAKSLLVKTDESRG